MDRHRPCILYLRCAHCLLAVLARLQTSSHQSPPEHEMNALGGACAPITAGMNACRRKTLIRLSKQVQDTDLFWMDRQATSRHKLLGARDGWTNPSSISACTAPLEHKGQLRHGVLYLILKPRPTNPMCPANTAEPSQHSRDGDEFFFFFLLVSTILFPWGGGRAGSNRQVRKGHQGGRPLEEQGVQQPDGRALPG